MSISKQYKLGLIKKYGGKAVYKAEKEMEAEYGLIYEYMLVMTEDEESAEYYTAEHMAEAYPEGLEGAVKDWLRREERGMNDGEPFGEALPW